MTMTEQQATLQEQYEEEVWVKPTTVQFGWIDPQGTEHTYEASWNVVPGIDYLNLHIKTQGSDDGDLSFLTGIPGEVFDLLLAARPG